MGTSFVDEDEEARSQYGRAVGERLRLIRRQKRLSLQEVEADSDLEFKASVLGAYERGERAISVPRLQRLARFYKVPVDQLLPEDGDSEISRAEPADARLRTAVKEELEKPQDDHRAHEYSVGHERLLPNRDDTGTSLPTAASTGSRFSNSFSDAPPLER